MAVPDARATRAGLPASDEARGINTDYFTAVWATKGAFNPTNRAFAKNLSSWAWGATDPDLCCSDGASPSYLLNTLSRQGTPAANASAEKHSYGFARFRVANMTLNDWLRSYFPNASTNPDPTTTSATAIHPNVAASSSGGGSGGGGGGSSSITSHSSRRSRATYHTKDLSES